MVSTVSKTDKDLAKRLPVDVSALFAARHQAQDGVVKHVESQDITSYSQLLDAVAHAETDEEAASLVIAAVESAIHNHSVEDFEDFQMQNELDLLNILDSSPDRESDENDFFIAGVIREHMLNGGDITLPKSSSENAQIMHARAEDRKKQEQRDLNDKIALIVAQIDKNSKSPQLQYDHED